MSGDPEPPFPPAPETLVPHRSQRGRPFLDNLSAIRAPLVLLCVAVLLLGFSLLLAYRRVALGFWDENLCVGPYPSMCQNALSALGALTSVFGLVLAGAGGVLAGWTALELASRACLRGARPGRRPWS